MPSLIDMRRRIRAVKSTQQITKAMKMVAASKLRRAQEKVVATRPFAREARRVLESIAGRVDQTAHPLLTQPARHGQGRHDAASSSRRIAACAAASTPTSSRPPGSSCASNPGRPVSFGLIGRKGRDMLGRRGLSRAVRARQPAEEHRVRGSARRWRRRRWRISSTARWTAST